MLMIYIIFFASWQGPMKNQSSPILGVKHSFLSPAVYDTMANRGLALPACLWNFRIMHGWSSQSHSLKTTFYFFLN